MQLLYRVTFLPSTNVRLPIPVPILLMGQTVIALEPFQVGKMLICGSGKDPVRIRPTNVHRIKKNDTERFIHRTLFNLVLKGELFFTYAKICQPLPLQPDYHQYYLPAAHSDGQCPSAIMFQNMIGLQLNRETCSRPKPIALLFQRR